MSIDPRNESEREIFAIEGFRVDVQYRIHKVMRRRGVTQRELARRLKLSESRVSQFFSDECNITIRQLAKIFHALEDECFVSSRFLEELQAATTLSYPAAPSAYQEDVRVAKEAAVDLDLAA